MSDRAPVETKNLDGYGYPALPWSRPHDIIAGAKPHPDTAFFLGTSRPDGRPHSAPLGALWHDGDYYFTSSPAARKARNVAENPACTLSMRLEGIDVVLEGEARRVTERATLEQIASLYRDDGWPVEAEGDAFAAPFSAPSAGPPPWYLYRFTFHTVFGVSTAEPWGATRWRFDS